MNANYNKEPWYERAKAIADEECFRVGDVIKYDGQLFLVTHIDGGRGAAYAHSPFVHHKGGLYAMTYSCVVSLFPIYGNNTKVWVAPYWGSRGETNFEKVGDFDFFRNLYREKYPYIPFFTWDKDNSPYFVQTKAGYFTLDALKKGITTPLKRPYVGGGDGVLYKWKWKISDHAWKAVNLE